MSASSTTLTRETRLYGERVLYTTISKLKAYTKPERQKARSAKGASEESSSVSLVLPVPEDSVLVCASLLSRSDVLIRTRDCVLARAIRFFRRARDFAESIIADCKKKMRKPTGDEKISRRVPSKLTRSRGRPAATVTFHTRSNIPSSSLCYKTRRLVH